MNTYIHIPFCNSKCRYCNIPGYTGISDNIINQYFYTLKQEICKRLKVKISTIYIGGGSPSLVPIKKWEEFFNFIQKKNILKDDIEISIELNPNQIDYDYLINLKNIGINRLSFGIQTFNKSILSKLNRDNGSDILTKFDDIFKIFYNVNGDLILGIPYSNFKIFKNDLKIMTSYPFTHLSIYKYENYNDLNNLPPEKELIDMIYYKDRLLSIKSFVKYEVSNYAKIGLLCKHNYDFWNNKDYIGIGAGAVSQTGYYIRENTNDIMQYINNIQYSEYKLTEKEYKSNQLLRSERLSASIAAS